MRRLGKSVLGLWVIGIALGVSAPAQADSPGPYYATPSWDQTLPAATRFIVLSNFGSAAVLDRETGLVWEKVPSAITLDWFSASGTCYDLNLGGRTGWRLPTIQELLSVVDRSQSNPSLPGGHPFTVLFFGDVSGYWSATTDASDATFALFVSFSAGGTAHHFKSNGGTLRAWCVRGGSGVDPQ